MDKLSEGFDRLCAESASFKMLFSLARAHDPYIPNANKSREAYKTSLATIPVADRPGWTKYFQDEEPKSFYDIIKELELPEDNLQEVWTNLSGWLRSVQYATSIFLANINEETAYNLALGHPIAIWLKEYVDILDASCSVGMVCWRGINGPIDEETLGVVIPPSLIRLPQLIIRFRTILLPVINGFHCDSVKQLQELRPEYIKS